MPCSDDGCCFPSSSWDSTGEADNGLADLPTARTVAVVDPSSRSTGVVPRRSPLVGRNSWRTGSLCAPVAGEELGWLAAPAGIGCPLTYPLHRSQRLGPWDDGLVPTTPRWCDVPVRCGGWGESRTSTSRGKGSLPLLPKPHL